MDNWLALTLIVELNYDTKIHWRDGWFKCPFCGESIRQVEYSEDFIDYNGDYLCPHCDSILVSID